MHRRNDLPIACAAQPANASVRRVQRAPRLRFLGHVVVTSGDCGSWIGPPNAAFRAEGSTPLFDQRVIERQPFGHAGRLTRLASGYKPVAQFLDGRCSA